MKKEVKKIFEFKHPFIVPDKDFKKIETAELTVHQYLELEDTKIIGKAHRMYFEVTIPKYIYEKVSDTADNYQVVRPEDAFARPKNKYGEEKFIRFKNVIRSMYFIDLPTEMDNITKDAIQVQMVEDCEKEKIICVNYKGQKHALRDDYNHASMGNKIDITFQWFVCYRRKIDYWGNERIVYEGLEQNTYGLQDQYKGYGFKSIRRDLEKEFKIITWTKEREEFFQKIETGFVGLIEKLDDFLGNLDDSKVDELMIKYKTGYFLSGPKEEVKSE